ncbi:MAG: hypothetical protein NTY83_04140 [Candidatus Micrarchaeota archaeon]|nr:hypothetical protein [Candidatus Micrarchaeota archaeon]
MDARETAFARVNGKMNGERAKPAAEFRRFSGVFGKPGRMEIAGAATFTLFNTALEYGKDAVGSVLLYSIGLSLLAAEKFLELTGKKKGF